VSTPSPREALLQRAVAYFVDHGVRDTSLRTLASEIGTSHRMLIYHFGSREGLLTAVVVHIWKRQQAVLEALTDASPTRPRENAWQLWQTLVNSGATALIFELSAPAMQGAPWAESFREGVATWLERIGGYLMAAGADPERAEVLARMGMAVVRGALWELGITGDREAADRTIRTFLDDLWPAGPVG